MSKKKIILLFTVSYLLCLAGMAYAFSQSLGPEHTTPFVEDSSLWQALIAALAGAVLTGMCLFFFVRRIISQYDDKHKQHDEDILNMRNSINLIEDNFTKGLDESTDLIMASLDGLKDDLREIITDVAILKEDRRRCVNINDRVDSNTGGLKVLGVQFESLLASLERIERQIEKQGSSSSSKN